MYKLIFVLLCASVQAIAQQESTTEVASEDDIFRMIESPAHYHGGQGAMDKYIKSNLQYPKKAMKKKVEGDVTVEVTIDKDGTVKDPIILKGADLKFGLPEEAVRIVSTMPKWDPAYRQKNKDPRTYVAIKTTVIIRFKAVNQE